jgi:outer membrane lipoprotein-sorting protein
MNCPSDDILAESAMGLDSADDCASLREHLTSCQDCRERSAQLQHLSHELAVAHRQFHGGHDRMREELLARLDEPTLTRANSRPHDFTNERKGALLMRRISLGVTTAVLAGVIVGIVWVNQPLSAFAQVTKGLREAKSYKCKLTVLLESDGQTIEEVGALQWAAPGSLRRETNQQGKPFAIEIYPGGKPGIEIQLHDQTYRRRAAQQGKPPALLALERLTQFKGRADRELDPVKIDGKDARGFEIAARKIDPDAGVDDKIRLWADTATNRPVRVEFERTVERSRFVFRHDEFVWDLPTEGWFDTTPPAGLKDATPVPPEEAKIVEHITAALRTYAKYNGGKYPQVKMVYGDVTRDQLFKNAGVFQRPKTAEEAADPKYVECQDAAWGFSHLNVIQRENAEAAYNGSTVDPSHKDKVLFRWKSESGKYHVIFGDLRHQTMEKESLTKLEAE